MRIYETHGVHLASPAEDAAVRAAAASGARVQVARYAMPGDSLIKGTPGPASGRSLLPFDLGGAQQELAGKAADFLRGLGLDPGQVKVTIRQADLVYSTDGWKTTRTTTWHPYDDWQGFRLPGVAPGTPVNFAIHAHTDMSVGSIPQYMHNPPDFWLNNGGWNYQGTTR